MIRVKTILVFVVIYLGAFTLLNSCSNTKITTYTKSKILFGTVINITVCGENAEDIVNLTFKRLQYLNDIFNIYNSKSLLSQLNKKKEIITNNNDLYKILILSKTFGDITNGAFDITIEPIVKLYKIYRAKKYVPSYKQIKQTLYKVNYNNIHIRKINTNKFYIYLNPNTSIDLGGVAKGYAVENISSLLKRKNIKYALIDAGGNLKVFGKLPFNKKWTIGIQHPRKAAKLITKVNILPKDSVSTSGDYFRYFIYGSRRYHHILNPKTGYPANECQSVTVISKNSTITDILSTSIFVLGPNKVNNLMKKIKKAFPKEYYRIYIVDKNGILSTHNFGDLPVKI